MFGEGRAEARLVFISEQPGDQEDRSGRPLVGPSGQLLHHALDGVEIPPREVWLTNTRPHFKFARHGRRTGRLSGVARCRRRLLVEPVTLVCLGATAAHATLGHGFSLRRRGIWIETDAGQPVLATVHPSWLLRRRGSEARERGWAGFVKALSKVRQVISGHMAGDSP